MARASRSDSISFQFCGLGFLATKWGILVHFQNTFLDAFHLLLALPTLPVRLSDSSPTSLFNEIYYFAWLLQMIFCFCYPRQEIFQNIIFDINDLLSILKPCLLHLIQDFIAGIKCLLHHWADTVCCRSWRQWNTFQIPWQGCLFCVFPPVPILDRVIARLKKKRSSCILVPSFLAQRDLVPLPPLNGKGEVQFFSYSEGPVTHGHHNTAYFHLW